MTFVRTIRNRLDRLGRKSIDKFPRQDWDRVMMVRGATVTGGAFLVIFGIINMLEGHFVLGIEELVLAGAGSLSLVSMNRRRRVEEGVAGVLIIMLTVLGSLVYSGGLEDTGVFWLPTFPVLAFFMARKRAGAAWTGILFLILVAATLLQWQGIVSTAYPLIELRQLIVSLLAVSLLILIFEDVNARRRRLLAKREQQLRRANRRLHDEKELTENNKRRLETILRKLPVGVFIVRAPDGKPQMANPRAIQLIGRGITSSADKGRYTKVYDLLTESGKPYPTDKLPVTITLDTGLPASKSDIVVRRPDKKLTTLQVYASPILDSHGKMTSVVAVFEDVTKQRDLIRAKDEFVSLASHQLRTPASGVKAMLSMLLTGDFGRVPSKQRPFLKEAFESNERQLRLIADLLSVARVDAGRFVLKRSNLDVGKLVGRVVREQKPLIAKRRQRVSVDTSGDLKVGADAEKLYMVLDNLVSNASKYTKPGGSIAVTAKGTPKRVTVRVSDTGVGIKRADRGKLFTKFGRVDNELSAKAGGTGLGLYLAWRIMALHKGRIGVQSKPGNGTTFTVTLPKRKKRP